MTSIPFIQRSYVLSKVYLVSTVPAKTSTTSYLVEDVASKKIYICVFCPQTICLWIVIFFLISTYFYSIIHPTVGTCFICYIWCIHHVAIYIITNFFLSNLLCRCTKNCNSPDYLVFFFSAITLHTDGWLQHPLLTTFKLHINPMHL